MTYQEVLGYLYSQLPMYQKQGATAFKKDLTNTLALCEFLGNPHLKIKTVHIAGTNGKGSTAHSIASVLQEAGYKTGLYTSPHLKDYRERIRINGEMIEEDEVINFVKMIMPKIKEIGPSFFEITVVMAFYFFAKQKVDMAVIETGLGGRLDSTNVVMPEISVITSIGMDHMDFLGNTPEAIAGEKAGIIKQGVPVVLPKYLSAGVKEVFVSKAEDTEGRVNDEAEQYSVRKSGQYLEVRKNNKLHIREIEPGIKGNHYLKNLPVIFESLEELKRAGYVIDNIHIERGIANVVLNTGLKGRWQQLGTDPLIIADVGHNADGWKEILDQLATISFRQMHIVLGMVKEKDAEEIFRMLPADAIYYLCEPKIPRAMKVEILADKVRKAGFTYTIVGDVNDSIKKAKEYALENDLIFIGGSTFVVAEITDL